MAQVVEKQAKAHRLKHKGLKSSMLLKPFLGIHSCFSACYSKQEPNHPIHSPFTLFILPLKYK